MRLISKIKIVFSHSDNLSNERSRRAAVTSLANLLGQVISLLTGLISVPLTLNYLGPERFGLWMALSTFLLFIAFSDFGISIGAQDSISRLVGLEKYKDARKVFLTSFAFVFSISCLLVLVAFYVLPQVPWQEIYSLKSPAANSEVLPTTKVLTLVLAAGLVSGVVQRTYLALQEGYVVAILNTISKIASLVLLIVAVEYEAGLPVLVFVIAGVGNLALLGFGLPYLYVRNPWLRIEVALVNDFVSVRTLSGILRVGALGLLASVAFAVVNNVVQLLISIQYGAQAVADYSTLLKLTSIPLLILANIQSPNWPAIADANARKDYGWILSVYKSMKRNTLLFTVVFGLGFLLFSRDAILFWTGNPEVVPSVGLLVPSVALMAFGFWNNLYSVILNGLSRFRSQATIGLSIAIVFGIIAAFLPKTFGKEALVWVTAIGYLVRCLIFRKEVNAMLLNQAQRR